MNLQRFFQPADTGFWLHLEIPDAEVQVDHKTVQ